MNSNNNDNENNGNNESNENNTNNTNNQNNYQIIIEELDNFTINENDEIHEFFFTLPINENANIFNTIESILENMENLQNNTNIINENNNNNEYYSFDIEFVNQSQTVNEYENNDYFLNSKDIDNRLSKCQKIKKIDKLLDEICFICMDNYKINELKRILPNCSHYFHKKCVDKWLKKKASCPVCRDELIK